ncbi:hypothetical protein BSKO_00760 [Bryopsis sp. KO-2023]|nr:hypothetical protein BSKO_00760 [Bryopsis sp. KO-2023]
MSDLWDYGDDCASEDSLKTPACPPAKKMCLSLLSDDESPPNNNNANDSSDDYSGSYTPVGKGKRKAEHSITEKPAKAQRSENLIQEVPVNEVAREQQTELAAMMDDFIKNIKEVEEPSEDEDEEEKGGENGEKVETSAEDPTQDDEDNEATKQRDDLAGKIVLVCQDSSRRSAKVRIGMDEEFESLFSRYKNHAVSKGWVEENDKLQFRFDDDVISASDTPEGLECEEQDKIDVFVV